MKTRLKITPPSNIYIYIKGGEERNKRRGGEMISEIVEGREGKKKEKKRVSDLTIKSQLFTFV